MIPLAGGISFGLAWGWLLAQRLGRDMRLPAAGIAGLAVLAPAGEAVLLAGGVVGLALAAATGAGAALRRASAGGPEGVVSDDASFLQLLGAGGFGAVIGWYVYFLNRYRAGDVALADLVTVIGAVGGGAILALFPAESDLFGPTASGLRPGSSATSSFSSASSPARRASA